MKKFLAVLLTLLMVFAMATTAFAADITIIGGADGSEYSAYRLLNAESLGGGKYSYTVNERYAAALAEVTGKTESKDIIDYISSLEDDADAVRAFADDVYALIKAMTADNTTTTDKFEGVEQGYYLIAETKVGNAQDTRSLVMLYTAGESDITITTKENAPKFEKKIKETNDSTGYVSEWQDAADYDIGDNVPYKLTGTVSDKYDSYKHYYYAFHDTMCEGLTFLPETVVVKVDGAEIASSYYNVIEKANGFDVTFDDLKDIEAVKFDSVITVEFYATLNDKAVIGKPGNPNEGYLEYSNNPYYEGKGKPEDDEDTGKTPEDKVIAFTYKLVADKVDGEGAPLDGAGFTLYKYDAEAEDYVIVGNEITGTTTFTFTGLDAGLYKLVESTVPTGYNKADDIYFSVEATYDTEADEPQLITIVIKDKDGNTIISSEDENDQDALFTTNVAAGSVNTKVVNNAGIGLPTTGGIGTIIFYVVGIMLMLAAAVLLITKKKMSAN